MPDRIVKHLKRISRREFLIASLGAGAAALMPRIAFSQSAEPYRIGVLLPTTGPGANYSERPIKGLPLIAAEINKRGGFLGKHPVELIFRDDQTKPDVGAREARSLILNEKVKTIIGSWSSAVAMAVQEIVHEHKVLHLAATSNSSKIVNENYTPYTFLFGPNSQMQSSATVVAVSRMIKEKGWKNYVTLGLDYEWGRDAQKVSCSGTWTAVAFSASELYIRSASAGSVRPIDTKVPLGCSYRPGGASEPINCWLPTVRFACMILFCHSGGTCSAAGVPACVNMAVILPPRHRS